MGQLCQWCLLPTAGRNSQQKHATPCQRPHTVCSTWQMWDSGQRPHCDVHPPPADPHSFRFTFWVGTSSSGCVAGPRIDPYQDYSRIMTRNSIGSYDRAMHRGIGPPYGRCVSLLASNPGKRYETGHSPPWQGGPFCSRISRVTSLIRNSAPLGPYSRKMPS